MTPVYYQIDNHLDREYKALDRDKITYWLFHFKNGIDIDDCRGGRIRFPHVRALHAAAVLVGVGSALPNYQQSQPSQPFTTL